MAEFRNYYNVSKSEVMNMKLDDYNFDLDNMKRAKARERLDLLELHIYTKVKQDTANKIHKKLVKTSNPPSEVAKRAVTNDDLKGFGGSIEDAVKGN